MAIELSDYSNIVVLTGAGISVPSGLRSYRGPGGLWTEGGDEHSSTLEGFLKDPARTWALFGPLRAAAIKASPNPAHEALAHAEQRCRGRFTILTQNVDGLHQRAGSTNVIELHGSLARTRCSSAECSLVPFEDTAHHTVVPTCERCRSPLRPDIVFFSEPMPVDAEWAAKVALRDVDLFLAIGTSGTVSPASGFVRSAAYNRARTAYINLEPMHPPNPYFQESHLGDAAAVLPKLLAV